MEKTIEIQLAEQAQKFIDAIERCLVFIPEEGDIALGISVGLKLAICRIQAIK